MTEEISTQSWGSRIKNAFFGILMGIGLIAGAAVLIFWNERHSLHTAQSLQHAQKILIPVPISPVYPQNNMKVIYLSGEATTKDQLTDDVLGITLIAINLNRTVEMYQWAEKVSTKTESRLGGSEKKVKSYSYTKEWSSNLIKSTDFKDAANHQNPSSFLIPSQLQFAHNVKLGDFVMPEVLIKEITKSQTVNLNQVDKTLLREKYNKKFRMHENELYVGQKIDDPQIGDLRITLSAAYPQEVSIIAQQTGKTLQEYKAPAGESVLLLESGLKTPVQMIEDAETQNKLFAWLWRLCAFVMLFIGFSLILKPVVVLADVIPLFGSIVGFGTGIIAFLGALSLWVLFTSIAWFTSRPLLSLGLLAALAIVIYLVTRKKTSAPTAIKEP